MSVQIRNPELIRLLAADFVTRRELSTTAGNRITLTNTDLVVSGGGALTLSAAGNYTLTIPATGTAALLGASNVFTGVNTFDDDIVSNSAIAVGVGTPLVPFHLVADGSGGASVAAFDFDNGSISRLFEFRTGTAGSSIGWDANNFFSFGTITAHNQGGLTSTFIRIDTAGRLGIGATSLSSLLHVNGDIAIVDGMSAPSTTAGWAKIYVDSADGDLKVKFGDGTTKTIATDT